MNSLLANLQQILMPICLCRNGRVGAQTNAPGDMMRNSKGVCNLAQRFCGDVHSVFACNYYFQKNSTKSLNIADYSRA